jgi:hypothetical protein
MSSIPETAAEIGQELLDANEMSLATVLVNGLSRFIGRPFAIGPGTIVDRESSAAKFASLVYAAKPGKLNPKFVPADSVAAAIDVCEILDIAGLRAAYARIAQCKRLKKTPTPRTDPPMTNVTLGIIFAKSASVPVEELAEELHRLNLETPAREWTDMVVIASTGTINYATQFPGLEDLGLFLPPAENALLAYDLQCTL